MFFLSASANILVYFLASFFFLLCVWTGKMEDLSEIPVQTATTLNPSGRCCSLGCYVYIIENRENKQEEQTVCFVSYQKRENIVFPVLPDSSPFYGHRLLRAPPLKKNFY